MIIYDIGANHGHWTQRNLSIYPEAKFVLVEANPSLCSFLRNKFFTFSNVVILNNCVSDEDNKKIKFYVNNSNHGISTASNKWIENSRFSKDFISINEINVDSITIDSLISQYGKSDYIKIDIEGYENVVIKGVKNYCGLLSFEWAEEMKNEIKESLIQLKSLGYKNYYMLEGTDDYSFKPIQSEYINYDLLLNSIETNLDEKRSIKWGMIYAY